MTAQASPLTSPLPVAERELVVTRTFNAPRDLVFKLWTDPKHAMHWWGPTHHPAIEMHMDPRVGGKWRNCLKSVEDGIEIWQHGVFREVVPPSKLVFTFTWEQNRFLEHPAIETLVSVTFEDRDGKTLMTLRQSPFHAIGDRDGHGEGWNSTFDRLGDYLATQSPHEMSGVK